MACGPGCAAGVAGSRAALRAAEAAGPCRSGANRLGLHVRPVPLRVGAAGVPGRVASAHGRRPAFHVARRRRLPCPTVRRRGPAGLRASRRLPATAPQPTPTPGRVASAHARRPAACPPRHLRAPRPRLYPAFSPALRSLRWFDLGSSRSCRPGCSSIARSAGSRWPSTDGWLE